MRITGGKYGGRRIKCPPGVIRPAMDRMRESMFSIIRNFYDRSFLDLFSGSGVVGIEAASRGASPIVLVEKDHRKRFIIKENTTFVEEELSICLKPVERYIKTCDRTFDLIYADPPFDYKNKIQIAELIYEKGILKADGIFFIHLPAEDLLPEQVLGLSCYDKREYGRSILMFFRLTEEEEGVRL